MKKSVVLSRLAANQDPSPRPRIWGLRQAWLGSGSPRDNKAIIAKVRSLERGKVYLVEGTKRLNNLPILLTHFYKNGIRFKPLCKYPNKVKNIWGNVLTQEMPSVPMTIKYERLPGLTFKEMDPSDIPLYLNRASPYMEDFFKKMGATHA